MTQSFSRNDADDIDGEELCTRISSFEIKGNPGWKRDLRDLDFEIAAYIGEFDYVATRLKYDPARMWLHAAWPAYDLNSRDVIVTVRNADGGLVPFTEQLPAYTASMDKAFEIITKNFPDDGEAVALGFSRYQDDKLVPWAEVLDVERVHACTPALALCAVAVSVMALHRKIRAESTQDVEAVAPRM